MKIQIESTNDLTEIAGVPVRRWEGVTAGGVKCQVFVQLIAVCEDQDTQQFEAELAEKAPPATDPFNAVRDLMPPITNSSSIKQIESSDAVVIRANVPEQFRLVNALFVGTALMLGKPLIAIVRPGDTIPGNLGVVIDRFVEDNANNHQEVVDGVMEACKDLGLKE